MVLCNKQFVNGSPGLRILLVASAFSGRRRAFGRQQFSLLHLPAPTPRQSSSLERFTTLTGIARYTIRDASSMLDRLSTEVLRAIIQEVSPSVWERKECLTQLGIVCISIRRAVKPIADEVVHVDRADAVAVIKRWPTACRKLVTTLLIGHDGTNTESKDALQIDERDLTRLLAALPAVKAVYVGNLAASPLPPDGVQAEAVTFATAQNNPFRSEWTQSPRTGLQRAYSPGRVLFRPLEQSVPPCRSVTVVSTLNRHSSTSSLPFDTFTSALCSKNLRTHPGAGSNSNF